MLDCERTYPNYQLKDMGQLPHALCDLWLVWSTAFENQQNNEKGAPEKIRSFFMKQPRRKSPIVECFSQDDFPAYRPLHDDLRTIQSMAAKAGKLNPLETISLEPKKIARNKAIRLGRTALASWYTRDFAILPIDSVIKVDACLNAAQNRLESFAALSGNGFVFGYGAHEFSDYEDAARAERMIEILGSLGVPVALVTSAAREVAIQAVAETVSNELALA